ncbi:MAG: DNA repair protein RecO [Planctomycetota bacterium]
MAIEKTNAILLRRLNFRNTSQIVTFLSDEHGLLPAIAKGSRRPKNALYGVLDYFNLGELVFYEKTEGQLHIVSQFTPEFEPLFLRESHCLFTAASALAEIILSACKPGESLPGVYQSLRKSLDALAEGRSPLQVISIFALAFLHDAGLGPMLNHCVQCQTPITSTTAYLDPHQGGCLCMSCSHTPATDPAVLSALRYLSRHLSEKHICSLRLTQPQERGVLEVLRDLLQAQLEVHLKTLPRVFRAYTREQEVYVA